MILKPNGVTKVESGKQPDSFYSIDKYRIVRVIENFEVYWERDLYTLYLGDKQRSA